MSGILVLFFLAFMLMYLYKIRDAEREEEETTESFDAELLRQEIARLYDLSEEMRQVDEMLIDLQVCRPAETEKYFRVDWMSSAGENRTIDFLADGENLTTERLLEIANDRRAELNQAIADGICNLYEKALQLADGQIYETQL